MRVQATGYLNDFDISINDGKHAALDAMELSLQTRFRDGMSPDILLGTLLWILRLAGFSLDPFLEGMNFKPAEHWNEQNKLSILIQQSLIQAATSQVRDKLIPCSPCYRYPGREILDHWVLPVGMNADTSLQTIFFSSGESRKFGRFTLTWDEFRESGVLTIRDLILDAKRLRSVKGVGSSAVCAILDDLPSHGFVSHTRKQLASR